MPPDVGKCLRIRQRWPPAKQQSITDLVLGEQVTGSVPDKALQTFYGTLPVSGQVYLRISPSLISMKTGTKGVNGQRMNGHGHH